MDTFNNLGQSTTYRFDYDPAILERFLNKHPENDYWVKFNCPEFTSLCPITGQPDYATIYISYMPAEKMVESKSLKLYLFSFRNHGAFHVGVDFENKAAEGVFFGPDYPFFRFGVTGRRGNVYKTVEQFLDAEIVEG